MAIKDYKTPLSSDPEAQKRSLAVIEKEFQTRFIGDSEDAARSYLKTMGISPSDADMRTASEKRDRAKYDELREFNPFEASRFGAKNPHVHKHGEDRTNAAMNMARARAIGAPTPTSTTGDRFELAAKRLRSAPTAPAGADLIVTPGDAK
jgi:hypothetical protein